MSEFVQPEDAEFIEFVSEHPELAVLGEIAVKDPDPVETVSNFYAAYRGWTI